MSLWLVEMQAHKHTLMNKRFVLEKLLFAMRFIEGGHENG